MCIRDNRKGMPRTQIATPDLTALFSGGVAPPAFELRENRCETTDMADDRAPYVQSSGHPGPLVTSCSWDVAARLTPAGETTLRNRRTEWLKAGVFNKLVEESIAGYDKIIGLDLSEVAVDGSLHKAPCGEKEPAPTPQTGPRSAGSGPSPPTCSGSRSAGLSTAPTATTASCSHRRCKPSPTAACSSMLKHCTWTAATTASSPRSAASPSASPTSSAPRRNAKVKPRSRNHSPWACAGPSNAPTPGYPTSANSAATPTGSACNVSARSPSPSPSS